MELVVQFVFVLVLLSIGLFFGRAAERRHYKELATREAELRHIQVFAERRLPTTETFTHARLVVGSVVIAEDYFKRFAAGLRSFFGGRLTAYESLMDRGRREAIVRMKQEALDHGCSLIFNVRLETSSLTEDTSSRSPMFSAEFMAYGTALARELREP